MPKTTDLIMRLQEYGYTKDKNLDGLLDDCMMKIEQQRDALKYILEMQTRGFIVLGDKASAMAKDAV